MSDLSLPPEWETWSLDQKISFTNELKFNWRNWARPNQLPPAGDWDIWLLLAGRGFGKSRTGAEYMKERMLAEPGIRVGIIGQTIGAARDICVEGESGLLSVINPELVQKYNRSLGQLRLKNGSMAFTFSGGDPEKLRGFQSHYLWLDELCAFQESQSTFDMALLGMRLGRNPRMVVTTTPKPTPLIIELVNRSRTEPDRVRITTGSTFDNAANLAESTLNSLRARYEGTTMGRQELYAELILEEPGALWKRVKIESNRVEIGTVGLEDMAEIVVGVDPNMSQSTERATECGIIVAGRGRDGHGYLFRDASLLRPSPDAWATQVVNQYHENQANQVVAEVNQGYDLVVNTIHTIDSKVPVKKVYSARGKMLRAEPIAALAEQGRIHHIGTGFDALEDQMVQWVPGNASPDRLDAYVHAFTKLMLGGGIAEFFTPVGLPNLPSVIR
jgi:phage terminase large subunit-like protein